MQPLFGIIPMTVIAFLLAFALSALSGLFFLPLLHRLKFGQTVREDGPQSHLKKTGTPTMGGVLFLFSTTVAGIVFALLGQPRILPLVLAMLAFGAVGFADDWLKVVRKHNEGLTPGQKMAGLLISAVLFTVYALVFEPDTIKLLVPFFHGLTLTVPWWVAGALAVFMLVWASNGVNLTDGVDGLCGSVSVTVALFFALVTGTRVEWYPARLFCAILAGGLLGYLIYNLHPAKVFMGDVGALGLGGAFAAMAVVTGLPALLVIAGGVYVLETLSVMLQVGYFKATKGKRIFRMAPVHHHFELGGWKENKVVVVFTLVSVLFCAIAALSVR